MNDPLAPFYERTPSVDDLAGLSANELTRIVDAAREIEALDASDLRKTRAWARDVRRAAEKAMQRKQ